MLHLPIVTIQPSFPIVISEVQSGIIPNDTFWISCYKSSETSIHAKIHAELDEVDRDLVRFKDDSGQVDLKRDGDTYSIACPALGIPHTKVLLPNKECSDPSLQRPKRIIAFDVAPDGSQFATGFHDGSVHIYPSLSPSGTLKSRSKPHLSYVSSVQYFPSSRVLLTAGADFALTILPAELPTAASDPPIEPVRKLTGHTRAITSTAIISRGRNVLSASKDGTIRLWDVGSGQQTKVMIAGAGRFNPVLTVSCGLKGSEWEWKPPDGEQAVNGTMNDTREVETLDKVVWCGLQDGSFEAFDLGSKQSVYRSSAGPSSINAIAYSTKDNFLATASTKGVLNLYDTRSLSTPLASFSRNTAAIECIEFIRDDDRLGVVIATEDGLPYIAGIAPEGPEVLAELVGTDCDAVRSVKIEGDHVWTAGDDGVVRRYVW